MIALILHGDCLDILKDLPDESYDSLVTDPPAGIAFMGKDWDKDKGGRDKWIEWMTSVMLECKRVLKPGAHGFVWALPRTSHWTATALEDAGFEVRDVVTHLFGSGFPKSHNVGKKLDDWQGWGTALKPASEHWILVRKPLQKGMTIVQNVQAYGTGAINIDASRIHNPGKRGNPCRSDGTIKRTNGNTYGKHTDSPSFDITQGRFPANLVLSHSEYCTDEQCDIECVIKALDEQSGFLHAAGNKKPKPASVNHIYGKGITGTGNPEIPGDKGGGASRFFYCAKPSKRERGKDNNHPTVKAKKLMSYLITMITPPCGTVLDPFCGSGSTGVAAKECGFEFIGIEAEKEYVDIANARYNDAYTHSAL